MSYCFNLKKIPLSIVPVQTSLFKSADNIFSDCAAFVITNSQEFKIVLIGMFVKKQGNNCEIPTLMQRICLEFPNTPLIICGNLNINFFTNTHFLNQMKELGFICNNLNQPTSRGGNSKNLTFVTNQLFVEVMTIPTYYSYHFPVLNSISY